jgi:hypothetical protein
MTTKNKPKNSIDITLGKDENSDDKVAQVFTKPSVQAALTIQEWEGDLYEFKSLQKTLSLQIDEVNNGNMKRPEAMLLAQAHTLDALFNHLARRARKVQSLKQFELDLRLALKAQSQCRATLETLVAIKNPPVVFAKQANISNGHQQINNGLQPTHAGKTKNEQNELLVEAQNGSETMDTRTTGETSGKDKAMATLE